jgi:glycosyltransferase involved in cell wall biosynthesis
MSDIPRVSIGFPVYNGERFLKQALDSLLQQTYADFELIVSDNASSDKTAEICAAYAAGDSRIRYYRNSENIGVDRNFNRTFQLSKGEYFRWSAADDVCARELLERSVEALDADQSVVLCYPKSRYIDDHMNAMRDYEDGLNLSFTEPNKRFAMFLRNVDMCNAVFGLIRSDVLRRTGLFGTYSDSDFVFLGEVALHGRFLEMPETLFFRRIHPGIAVRKYPTAQERMVMSEPALAGRLSFPHWKVVAGFLSAIHRAPLTWRERLLCYGRTHIWLRRRRHDLKTDLSYAVKFLIAKVRRRRQH